MAVILGYTGTVSATGYLVNRYVENGDLRKISNKVIQLMDFFGPMCIGLVAKPSHKEDIMGVGILLGCFVVNIAAFVSPLHKIFRTCHTALFDEGNTHFKSLTPLVRKVVKREGISSTRERVTRALEPQTARDVEAPLLQSAIPYFLTALAIRAIMTPKGRLAAIGAIAIRLITLAVTPRKELLGFRRQGVMDEQNLVLKLSVKVTSYFCNLFPAKCHSCEKSLLGRSIATIDSKNHYHSTCLATKITNHCRDKLKPQGVPPTGDTVSWEYPVQDAFWDMDGTDLRDVANYEAEKGNS